MYSVEVKDLMYKKDIKRYKNTWNGRNIQKKQFIRI